jgi:sterol 3beta-glucosyltransferase
MRIAVLSLGSRGDVQPMVALAAALTQRGHDVRVVAHENFAPLAEGHGVAFRGIPGDFGTVLGSTDGKRMTASGRNPLAIVGAMRAIAAKHARDWLRQVREHCSDIDVVVSETTTFPIAASLAERSGIAWVHASFAPVSPTGAFPSPILPFPAVRLPGWANKLQHQLGRQLLWQAFRRTNDDLRRDMGLPPWPLAGPFARFDRERRPVLMAFSEQVVPRPTDWAPHLKTTGYWFLDRPASWAPPPDLVRFLEAGPPPVYIGFGSMSMSAPRDAAAIVAEAIGKVGCRAVIDGGWAGLRTELRDDAIFVVDDVPHDWLFPRMAAVVHHCGAGTTAAALRADVPSIGVPFMADQFFWAWRLKQLELSAGTIPHRKLATSPLTAALRRALDDGAMLRRAHDMAARLRAEDGLASAVGAVEKAVHAS